MKPASQATHVPSEKENLWISWAKWTCAVSSVLLVMNLLGMILFAKLPASAVATTSVAALLFTVCAVGYITEAKWVLTYSLILVAATYLLAGAYWLATRVWMGFLPSLFLVVLLLGRRKLETSLKAQKEARSDNPPQSQPVS